MKLYDLKRGASETCLDNLLPLGLLRRSSHGYEGWNGGGLSLPAIASLSSLRRGGLGEGGKPGGLTLPFVPSPSSAVACRGEAEIPFAGLRRTGHQGRGIIRMRSIRALKGAAFWRIAVKEGLRVATALLAAHRRGLSKVP